MTVTTEPQADHLAGKVAEPGHPIGIKPQAVEEVDQLENTLAAHPTSQKDLDPLEQPGHSIEGVSEEERLEIIRQIEFYFSDANLPFDKFMFLQTSPHLDSVKAPNLSPEAKEKAEAYGPGCSPVLLQTVASFKRMRAHSSKFPTSKLAKIIQTSPTTPKLVDVITEEVDGKPTLYVRRLVKLEETSRAGASDRCVYVKGFMGEEDLATGEPANMQVQLEKWAKQWGPVAVLRMRRENEKVKESKEDKLRGPKKWKNSVFIEYTDPQSAEQLVHQFKQDTDKPQFEGRELSSIMFKIDYVTMKANEKGLPPPKMSGKRQAGQQTSATVQSGTSGLIGGNSSTFNAFKEIKAIAAGSKKYAGGPYLSKDSKPKEEAKTIEYEGNKLQVNNDGSLKNPEELKSYRSNMALAFELEGEAPKDFKEARVDYRSFKESLTEGELVCNVVHVTPTDKAKGTVGFDNPISDEQFAQIQAKGVRSGGRSVKFTRLDGEQNRQFHLDCAALRAKATFAPKTDNQHKKGAGGDRGGGRRGRDAGRGGRDGGRGGRDGGRGGRGGRGNNRSGGRDRNAEKDANGHADPATTGEENKTNSPTVTGNKRDAEGNIVSNGAPSTAPSTNSVPEIGRAEKKPKVSA